MRIFRDPSDKPNIDLDRLTRTLADQAKRERELDRIIAELVRDQPGNAAAVAAAGIANRAQLTGSASMIEFGAAAVDALRRAGYLPVSIALAERKWLPAHPGDPANVAAAELENSPGQPPPPAIPDDWA